LGLFINLWVNFLSYWVFLENSGAFTTNSFLLNSHRNLLKSPLYHKESAKNTPPEVMHFFLLPFRTIQIVVTKILVAYRTVGSVHNKLRMLVLRNILGMLTLPFA